MSDKIGLDIGIINIRFKYSDTDTVSDVEYSDSDTDTSLNEFGLEYANPYHFSLALGPLSSNQAICFLPHGRQHIRINLTGSHTGLQAFD